MADRAQRFCMQTDRVLLSMGAKPFRFVSRLGPTALAIAVAVAWATGAWSLTTGEPAPACSVPLLESGRTINVADFRGNVVYLDFWASWCGPCRQSFPFMNELQQELAGKGLSIVAVSVDKTAEDARGFLAKYPAHFATALDAAGVCPKTYGLQGMPSSFVIDRKGVVRAVHAGFRNSDKAGIRTQLLEALSESR
jgi:thiol-disulfide isomerase/thioredoxin